MHETCKKHRNKGKEGNAQKNKIDNKRISSINASANQLNADEKISLEKLFWIIFSEFTNKCTIT